MKRFNMLDFALLAHIHRLNLCQLGGTRFFKVGVVAAIDIDLALFNIHNSIAYLIEKVAIMRDQ